MGLQGGQDRFSIRGLWPPLARILVRLADGVSQRSVASDRAAEVLRLGSPVDDAYLKALADFDLWLRADSNRCNPGTTADLTASSLFVALLEGWRP